MKSTIERAALALLLATPLAAEPVAITVRAAAETEGTSGDTDDPAIWVNPADPAASLILGADKAQGLYVYTLDGAVREFFPDGDLNNVDLRPMTLAGRPVWIAGATRRDDETLVFYVIDPAGAVTRATPWQHAGIPADLAAEADDIYGFALGQDAGGTYAFVSFKSGHIVQWRIDETAPGVIDLAHVRSWRVATQPEGIVADDRAGHVYVGEEDRGIWRYPLSPSAPAEATGIASIPSPCLPRDDVEGLAIHDGAEGSTGRRYLP